MGQPEQVKAAYESAWGRMEAAVAEHVGRGERELARLLNLSYARAVGATPPGERVSALFGTEVPAPYLYANRVIRDWIADTVVEAAADVDAVVETGSGFGYNLFNVFLRGGPDVPYHAFEYTEAGRRCCRALADAAAVAPRVDVHPFDYRAADFSSIAGLYRHVLLYTSHSIEQIEELPESFVQSVLSLAPRLSVLHFEPVGWQLGPASGRVDGREHAARYRYNTNLVAMLRQMESAGRLKIGEIRRDVMAVKIYNPTTLVAWSKEDAAAGA